MTEVATLQRTIWREVKSRISGKFYFVDAALFPDPSLVAFWNALLRRWGLLVVPRDRGIEHVYFGVGPKCDHILETIKYEDDAEVAAVPSDYKRRDPFRLGHSAFELRAEYARTRLAIDERTALILYMSGEGALLEEIARTVSLKTKGAVTKILAKARILRGLREQETSRTFACK